MDGIGEFSLQVVRVIFRAFFEALFEFLLRLIGTPICRVVSFLYGEMLRDFRRVVKLDVLAIPLAMLLLVTATASFIFFSVRALQWLILLA